MGSRSDADVAPDTSRGRLCVEVTFALKVDNPLHAFVAPVLLARGPRA